MPEIIKSSLPIISTESNPTNKSFIFFILFQNYKHNFYKCKITKVRLYLILKLFFFHLPNFCQRMNNPGLMNKKLSGFFLLLPDNFFKKCIKLVNRYPRRQGIKMNLSLLMNSSNSQLSPRLALRQNFILERNISK